MQYITTKTNGGLIMLTKGTDYTVTYENNTEIGAAAVIIAGKDNFTVHLTNTLWIVE